MYSNLSDMERTRALKICKQHLKGAWKTVTSGDVEISQVSGGMSNLLYRCALGDKIQTESNEPREVLLRIYGNIQDDIDVQLKIFKQLAATNLGPNLHVSFDEGRIEEFLPSNPLSWSELTSDSISQVVAAKIAAIHKLPVQELNKHSSWLLDRYNEMNSIIKSTSGDEIKFVDESFESTKSIAREMLEINFTAEIDYLSNVFKRCSNAPLVFSHNDLHQNNIILLDDLNKSLADRVVLVDFEYSSYNYRAFDLANHLSEWCFDYSLEQYPNFAASLEWFPSEKKQRQFLTHYVKEADLAEHFAPSLNLSDKVELLFNEIQPFFMAANFLWSIWAIKGARTSKIKFGYWEMAKYKWDIYMMCKKKFESRLLQNSL